jgi:PAS domain S-box-containing protein
MNAPEQKSPTRLRAGTAAESFLAAIVESSDDAIISEDLSATVMTWNKAAERLFGYRAEEILGKSIVTIIPPERHGEENTILERIQRGERIERFETVRVRKDGSRIDILLTVSPIKDATGKIIGASKIARSLTEHKRTEEALRSEQRLRLILDAAPNGMVMVNKAGTIVLVNAQMEKLFGYTRDEMIGQRVEMLLPERYRAAHPGQRGEFFSSPATRAMGHGRDLFARRKDGSEFPVEVGLNPATTPEGEFVLAAVIDITARKKAEEAAVKSATQLRLIVEAAPNGMVMVNESGEILMVNAQMEKLFGYTRAEIIGQRIEMLLPERYRGGHPKLRDDYFQSPLTRAMGHGRDLYARRKDGSEFPVEVGLNPAETPDGTVVLAAVIDITARKKAEEALAKSAAQFRLVVESAPNGLVMVNESGEILMVNSQTERLFGYTRAEMIGQHVEMLLPNRYRAAHPGQRGDYFRSPATRAMGHGRDLFARRKDGSEFPVEVGLNPAETPDGTVVLAAVIDITQRKAMEAELAQAHAQLSDRARDLETIVAERTAHLQATIAELESVSYSLSHDMRAPLRTIQSFSQIVLEDAGDRLRQAEKDLLAKSISAADRLDRLIKDVLTFSRISRGPIELGTVDVENLLRQILHERPEFQAPKAEIEIQGPLALVCGHEVRRPRTAVVPAHEQLGAAAQRAASR